MLHLCAGPLAAYYMEINLRLKRVSHVFDISVHKWDHVQGQAPFLLLLYRAKICFVINLIVEYGL
jgi:hypothetical protein